MPQPASGHLPATPSKPLGHIGRFVRLGLIGLVILPIVLGDRLGLAASTQSLTVEASADAQVRANFPTRNYGDGIRLRTRVKVRDNQRTLIRFTLPAFEGSVKSVQLRLFVRDRSDDGGSIRQVLGPWSESSVTWLKAPLLASRVIGRIGSTGRTGSWIGVPLKLDGLRSGQKVDLAIVGASANGALFASRESGKGPRLIVTFDRASTPPAAPTSNPTTAPASNPTPNPASNPTSAPPVSGGNSEAGAAPASGKGPLVCPPGRVNFESRGWWTPAGVHIDEYRGIDIEMCFPTGGTLSGNVPFLLHVQLRDNPAVINFLRIAIADSGGNSNGFYQKVHLDPGPDGYGEWYIPAVVNTRVRGHDGWQEFRFTANVSSDPDHNRHYQSTGLQANLQNGLPEQGTYRRNPWWESRGWYESTGYTNVRLFQVPPTAPVSGNWAVRWSCSPTGSPATYHALYVDANTHAIPMVLPRKYSEGTGAFNGTTNIDTTALSNGLHKLLLRCDARIGAGTDSALTQILFRVNN